MDNAKSLPHVTQYATCQDVLESPRNLEPMADSKPFTMRVERVLLSRFDAVCRKSEKKSAEVLREFMLTVVREFNSVDA